MSGVIATRPHEWVSTDEERGRKARCSVCLLEVEDGVSCAPTPEAAEKLLFNCPGVPKPECRTFTARRCDGSEEVWTEEYEWELPVCEHCDQPIPAQAWWRQASGPGDFHVGPMERAADGLTETCRSCGKVEDTHTGAIRKAFPAEALAEMVEKVSPFYRALKKA